jgi:hypothetical protein
MGPGGEAWMFPEALDLEGSEAQEGRGSDGAFVAVKGELILIWRRFGRIERCRLHAGELERVVSVILPPDPTLTCATASTCSRARASGADAAKLGHETHQNTSKLAARLVYRIFLRDLRYQRSGGGWKRIHSLPPTGELQHKTRNGLLFPSLLSGSRSRRFCILS